MYRTIDASFWNDPKVRKLSAQAKLAFLYLITNPHSHVGGIYYLPTVMATTETGLSRRDWDRVCDTLSGAGLARFDPSTDVVWVVNMLGYQARGEKADRAVANHLATLHNSLLIQEFLLRYDHVRPYVKDRVSIGYPAQDRFGTQEQEQKQEQKEKETANSTKADFERFWQAFPSGRKSGKGVALKAWQSACKKADAETIISAATEYAASPAGRGEFVKGPATWLNGECWSDDRAAWNRQDSRNGHPAAPLYDPEELIRRAKAINDKAMEPKE